MPDPVHALYQARAYPAVSHPSTDPASTAVAAKLAGLDVTPPSRARILDIGCASGQNLLPLAARWPGSRFTGIDFSETAIEEAREIAGLAGLTNVEFIHADLRDFDPGDAVSYDFIIAHGVYSWVPDEVRQALLDFCGAKLSSNGVALISYNTLPGWSLRKTIADLTETLIRRPIAKQIGQEPEAILGLFATAAGNHTPYARYLTSVLHDMFGKGDNAHVFDDFAPINTPSNFLDFTDHAGRSGLRYLGESRLAEDFPASLAREAAEILKPMAGDPSALQQTIDVLTNRTFRSSLLCRADAPVQSRVATADILDFSIRTPHAFELTSDGARLLGNAGEELARFVHPAEVAFFSALSKTRPESVPVHEVIANMAENSFDVSGSVPLLVRLVIDSARRGLVLLRTEPVRFDAAPPAFPNLGPLRLLSARRGRAVVDTYHSFSELDDSRRKIAAAMDGSRSADELAALAKTMLPDLDFLAWLRHLAARGMFAGC
ncbi:MAG: class I SAM-dependent methyltransferase [Luteolibacter sp.]|uniref:class I SAM-dependent methyltransferase n=1 Tax=Luteolibacter sp. TaxID=1962973 RepID=UPI003267B14D